MVAVAAVTPIASAVCCSQSLVQAEHELIIAAYEVQHLRTTGRWTSSWTCLKRIACIEGRKSVLAQRFKSSGLASVPGPFLEMFSVGAQVTGYVRRLGRGF